MRIAAKLFYFRIKVVLLNVTIFCLLGFSNFIIRMVKFKDITAMISNCEDEPCIDAKAEKKSRLMLIRRQIELLSEKTPWRSMCFEQALTAAFLLKLFRFSYTVFWGLKREGDGRLKAHAWTRAGGVYITGYKNMNEYHEIYHSGYKTKQDSLLTS